ncbi:MAG: TolC family protein [Flavobacteriales bacterium]|nr:TolC family protein [Flavobacteriales bacterium]
MKRTSLTVLILISWIGLFAQTPIGLDSAIAAALSKHPQLLAAQKELEEQAALKKGSFSLSDPQVLLEAPSGEFFTVGVQQSVDNPLVYMQQSKVGKQQIKLAETNIVITRSVVIRQVSEAYNQLQYAEARIHQAFIQDSVFNAMHLATEKRHQAGDAGLLAKTSASARAREAEVTLVQAKEELKNARLGLQLLTGLDASGAQSDTTFEKMELSGDLGDAPSSVPFIDYANQNTVLAKQQLKLAKSGLAPGFSLGYLNQAERSSSIPQRFQFGITVPVWYWTHKSRIKAAKANAEKTTYNSALAVQNFNVAWLDAIKVYQINLVSLQYYETSGLEQADIILDAALRSYTAGEVSFLEYMFTISQAFDIKTNYYTALKKYNTSVIELNFLQGK